MKKKKGERKTLHCQSCWWHG